MRRLLPLFVLAQAYAQKEIIVPFTLADRERLIRVEAEQHTLRREMESLRREIGGLRKEMDGLRREMDGLRGFMVALVATQAAIVIGIFGGIGYRLG